MLRKVKSLLIRYKYAALGVVAVLAAAAIVAISLNLSNEKGKQPLTAAPTPTMTPASTPATPTDGSTATPEPGATAPSSNEPTQAPESNGKFAFTICPADVILNPKVIAESSSGFTPVVESPRQPLDHIRMISTGHIFDEAGYGSQFGTSYALADDGTLYNWGIVSWENRIHPAAFPQKVTGITGTIKQVDGRYALTEEGDVYELLNEKSAKRIKELSGSVAIAQARESSVYAIDKNGVVLYYTLYGPNGTPYTNRLTGLGKIKSITASPFIMLATTQEGKLLRLDAYNTPETKPASFELPDGERVKQIHLTMSYMNLAYMLSDKGHWFVLNHEQKLERAVVPDNTVQVTAMEHDTVALKADGTVWAWGEGGSLLPYEGIVSPENARQIKGFAGVKSIAAGQSHLLALTTDGHVLSAGSNMYGQLGWKSVYAESPTPIGSWQGMDAMFPVYNKLFVITHGDVWSLDANNNVKPVLLGQKAKKAFSGLGHFAILTDSGKLIVADPDETQPCRVLQAPSPIIDAASTNNGIVLALKDGRVFLAEGNMRSIGVKSEVRMEPKPTGKVMQVFGDPIPFVLTDKGELYFRAKTENGVPILKPVKADAPIKQWSPLGYYYYDNIDYIGKALDGNNRVYDVNLRLNRDGKPENETAAVELKKTQETGVALIGGAVIDANGRLTEKSLVTTFDTKLPEGTKLHAATSFYHIPIEGRTYMYHVFASEDGTMYWLGSTQYDGPKLTPKPVLAP